LQINPKNSRACNNLGGIFLSLGHVDESITCFLQALVIDPAVPEVHFNVGNALLHARRHEEAVASLQQCLQLKPDFEECRIKLEQAQQQLKNQGK